LSKLVYSLKATEEGGEKTHAHSETGQKPKTKSGKIQILVPKRSSLKHRLHTKDLMYLDFIRWCLEIDPHRRPTAKEALNHPWLTEAKYKS